MKYFIGGVGQLFCFNGTQQIFRATTLINSSIEISTDTVEARGGDGNKLLGRYFHSATMKMTIEDAIFDLNYLALNVGATKALGADNFKSEQVTLAAGGAGLVTNAPAKFGNSYVGWAAPVGDPENVQTVTISIPGKAFTFAGGASGDVVCVTYPTYTSGNEYIDIPVNFIPATAHAHMIAKLYRASGSSTSLSSSTVVGTVEFDIPRLQFAGNESISMTSTGVSNTPLEATALAVEDGTCDGAGTYGRVVVHLTNANWYDNIDLLAIDPANVSIAVAETVTPSAYGLANNTQPYYIQPGELTYTSSDDAIATVAAGVITGVAVGSCYIEYKITSKPAVKGYVEVTVA